MEVKKGSTTPAEDVIGGGDWGETYQDIRDMQRLGKKQVFKRNFGFWGTLGFVSIYMATWEVALISSSAGFRNGGFAGLLWTYIGTTTCYASIVASLAELESMAPTSGGQYHWVSEFAPAQYQKFLSYSAGWMSTLGWLSASASGAFLSATVIQTCAEIIQPEFSFTSWQLTIIMLGFIIAFLGFNTIGSKALPALETLSLVGHVLGFIIVIIVCWVMCRPLNTASDVFTRFMESGGWGSIGTGCLLSQVTVIFCIIGSDSIVHISEEVGDASSIVPRTMWWSYIYNVVLGGIILVTMLFCIGPLEDVLQADAPYLPLFRNTGSQSVALLLTIILLILLFAGNIAAFATVTREVWAFSRDKGFPFSRWISRMNRRYNIPFNSAYTTSVLSGSLSLINLGSTFTFNIMVSLPTLALLSTYTITTGCMLLLRIKGEPLPPARWSLGRFGLPINAFAFLYSVFVIVLSCFPTSPPAGLRDANWAPVIWAGVIVLSMVTYALHGRKHFTPPVMFIEGRRVEGVGIQAME
ncbi:polyamine transporter tpo5 [Paramarasmius palmivorus]|uniref:Polyamine transporter tpo5 n=1 Tax=Paramarasmius palmivorus TaxID=297713 RepID=A0AAW0D4R6_9AGAR